MLFQFFHMGGFFFQTGAGFLNLAVIGIDLIVDLIPLRLQAIDKRFLVRNGLFAVNALRRVLHLIELAFRRIKLCAHLICLFGQRISAAAHLREALFQRIDLLERALQVFFELLIVKRRTENNFSIWHDFTFSLTPSTSAPLLQEILLRI